MLIYVFHSYLSLERKFPLYIILARAEAPLHTVSTSIHHNLPQHNNTIAMATIQSAEAVGSSFPTNVEEFDSDDRISFSTLDNKFLLVQADGTEFEFDRAIKRWIPVLDEALLEEQQRAYQVSGVDENEPVDAMRKKRKKEYVNGEDV